MFMVTILVLIALDLGLFQKKNSRVSFARAASWTAFSVVLALCFNVFLYYFALDEFANSARLQAIPGFNAEASAKEVAIAFLTGYLVEQSLSVDNIFVFVVVFTYFGIAPQYQRRVLFLGIMGALIFRGIFIAAGSALMEYEFVVHLFGVFLLFTGIKMMFAPDKKIDPEKNPVIKVIKKVFPITPHLDGEKFFVKIGGKLHGTPMLVALIFLEMTDVIFAVDSVPAIFAITSEPLIVFTSNVCAIMNLRSLYFLLAAAIERFHLLKYGLALILTFVGLKMLWLDSAWNGKFPEMWSLGIISGLLFASILLSFVVPAKKVK